MRYVWLIPLASLTLAAPMAVAGPVSRHYSQVPWSYSVRVIYPEDYGQDFRVDLPNGPTGSSNSHHGYYSVFGPTFGDLPRGDESFRSFSFTAELTITDTDSGESGVFTLPAVAGATRLDYEYGGYAWTSAGILYPEQQENPGQWYYRTVKLGENEYSIQGVGNAFRLHAEAPDHPHVPEPGTLTLAGLGLSAVGGWWVRRRRG